MIKIIQFKILSIGFKLISAILLTVLFSCNPSSNNDSKNTAGNDDKKSNSVQDKSIKQSAQHRNEVVSLSDQNFDETIKSGVTLIDFWATWCKPCKLQAPIVEEINKELAGKAKICKIDIDNSRDIANRFGIQSIPTIIIFKEGKAVEQFVGVTSKEELLAAIQKQLK